MQLEKSNFLEEFEFKNSRSSGKGGQHVNKTESRVSLFFNVQNSNALSDEQKAKLSEKLKHRISQDGTLQIDVESSRSQHQNKKIAIERFFDLIEEALKEKKARKITKPSKAAIRKRLKEKKIQSEKKQNRRKEGF
tara:strand:- start:26 stop:433 length:408 start_codon:yes stop_codon:yes gene_type:complete